jgi:hypothetical protein
MSGVLIYLSRSLSCQHECIQNPSIQIVWYASTCAAEKITLYKSTS